MKAIDTRKLGPLRQVARELGADTRDTHITSYLTLYDELAVAARVQPKRNVSSEAAEMLAKAILLNEEQFQCVTYICVSDYVGGTRYRLQNKAYSLTSGECAMLERAVRLRNIASTVECSLEWQLILADGWGLDLYGDRVEPGALDSYCTFMEKECSTRGLRAIRWSTLMGSHRKTYDKAVSEVHKRARELAPWEATKGEIAHDNPATDHALQIAETHIKMRAAESAVVVADRGQTLVLSTEGPGLVRYDNLVIPKRDYTHLFIMPHYPHRLP